MHDLDYDIRSTKEWKTNWDQRAYFATYFNDSNAYFLSTERIWF